LRREPDPAAPGHRWRSVAQTLSLGSLAALSLAACSGEGAPAHPRCLGVRTDAIRPTDARAQFHFDADSEVRSYAAEDSAVRVHYATQGRHATRLEDSDGDSVPDFVTLVAETGDEMLRFWAAAGLRAPVEERSLALQDDGGDERFDIYLVDFDISADGYFGVDACSSSLPPVCAGHLVVENDFREQGYPNLRQAVRILVSHEGFHAIQAAYLAELPVWWSEATATWSEEHFDPSQSDFEAFLPGYFERPDRSLDAPLPGPVDPFSYGLAIFPQFLSERYAPSVLRRVFEELGTPAGSAAGPLSAVDAALSGEHGASLPQAYQEFAEWNLLTAGRADPERSYAQGRRYPAVAWSAWADLPYEDSLRVFHLASVVLSLGVGERSEVTAAVVGGDSDLRLALLPELSAGGAGALLRVEPPDGAGPVLATAGLRRVIVLLSNVSVAGRSQRPTICVGTPAEVESCVRAASEQPDLGPPDLGPLDLGSPAGDLGAGAEDLGQEDAGPGSVDLATAPLDGAVPLDGATAPDSGAAAAGPHDPPRGTSEGGCASAPLTHGPWAGGAGRELGALRGMLRR